MLQFDLKQRFNWNTRKPEPQSAKDGDWYHGTGMSSAIYPTMMSPVKSRAKIFGDGTALSQAATQEIGQGPRTVLTQNLADTLALPLSQAHFEVGDTDYPAAPVSGGSRGAVSVGTAVLNAANNLIHQLTKLAIQDRNSPLFQAYRLECGSAPPQHPLHRLQHPVPDTALGARRASGDFLSVPDARRAKLATEDDLAQADTNSRRSRYFSPGGSMRARTSVMCCNTGLAS